ncbi:hypothetical protein ABPG72_015933 [Tetrahymena utriculariae]
MDKEIQKVITHKKNGKEKIETKKANTFRGSNNFDHYQQSTYETKQRDSSSQSRYQRYQMQQAHEDIIPYSYRWTYFIDQQSSFEQSYFILDHYKMCGQNNQQIYRLKSERQNNMQETLKKINKGQKKIEKNQENDDMNDFDYQQEDTNDTEQREQFHNGYAQQLSKQYSEKKITKKIQSRKEPFEDQTYYLSKSKELRKKVKRFYKKEDKANYIEVISFCLEQGLLRVPNCKKFQQSTKKFDDWEERNFLTDYIFSNQKYI